MPTFRQRTSILDIPNRPTPCPLLRGCVYRDSAGICDEPRINKQNGDSACHRMNNRDVVAMLKTSLATL